MDDLFPKAPGLPWEGPEHVEHLDPLLERRLHGNPWEVRSAQWRAWTLAEAAFGASVRVHLTGRTAYRGIRGLLTVTVPFRDLEDHRGRESVFLSWASRDPILTQVPLIFVFQPDPLSPPAEAVAETRAGP
jgi:hypothetical protein